MGAARIEMGWGDSMIQSSEAAGFLNSAGLRRISSSSSSLMKFRVMFLKGTFGETNFISYILIIN